MKQFTIEELENSPLVSYGDRYLLQDGVFHDGSPSGTIHSTQEEAEKYRSILVSNAKSRLAAKQEREEQERAEAEKEANLIASYGGWLSSSPMKAGKQRKTMERRFRYRGQVMTRKEIIELLVSEGRVLTDKGLEKENTFYEVNKTEREYAEFLIENERK